VLHCGSAAVTIQQCHPSSVPCLKGFDIVTSLLQSVQPPHPQTTAEQITKQEFVDDDDFQTLQIHYQAPAAPITN